MRIVVSSGGWVTAQWSEHEARSVLQAWRSSGLSIERFATERGILPQRLRWWKRKFADVEAPETPPAENAGLLPVRVVEGQRGTPIQIILPKWAHRARRAWLRRGHVRTRA